MARESLQRKHERVVSIVDTLAAAYPDARVGLDFTTPFELLIATILSAQCTDERVNQVTPHVFAKYHGPQDYLRVPVEELEVDIHSTGFYRNKARNIQACCQELIDRFGGEVPTTLDELVSLPGVGRKTANCVLSNCWNIPGITVDTHVTRLSNLLKLTTSTDAVRIEFDLMKLIDRDRWNTWNHLIITHGRRTCIARRPKCDVCPIIEYCPSSHRSV